MLGNLFFLFLFVVPIDFEGSFVEFFGLFGCSLEPLFFLINLLGRVKLLDFDAKPHFLPDGFAELFFEPFFLMLLV
jgi:hypothetical protein